MNIISRENLLERLINYDMRVCCYFNRHVEKRLIRHFFSIISRLGDGAVWYMLMLIIPLVYGTEYIHVSFRMLAAGLTGLLIYKVIKRLTERQRPFIKSQLIKLGTAPLDQYSFPSGHTLHAVSFSLIVIHYFPMLAWMLAPFTFLIASSRVVLGLHFPTDVFAGALIGFSLALLSVSIV